MTRGFRVVIFLRAVVKSPAVKMKLLGTLCLVAAIVVAGAGLVNWRESGGLSPVFGASGALVIMSIVCFLVPGRRRVPKDVRIYVVPPAAHSPGEYQIRVQAKGRDLGALSVGELNRLFERGAVTKHDRYFDPDLGGWVGFERHPFIEIVTD